MQSGLWGRIVGVLLVPLGTGSNATTCCVIFRVDVHSTRTAENMIAMSTVCFEPFTGNISNKIAAKNEYNI